LLERSGNPALRDFCDLQNRITKVMHSPQSLLVGGTLQGESFRVNPYPQPEDRIGVRYPDATIHGGSFSL